MVDKKWKVIEQLLDKYEVRDMTSWESVQADLIITDPPFGIEFSGRNGNYNRKVEHVVDGYVEWPVSVYSVRVHKLLMCIEKNLKENGQALIFSGWNNSSIIQDEILRCKGLTLRGKMYWTYNFAPACKKKPAHNVYEIFWVTKGDAWTYHNRCTTAHCLDGEPNLTTLTFKRDYRMNMPKYPTRLPFDLLQSLIEHYSNKGDLVFDPLAGSGMVGIAADVLGRDFVLGDLNVNGKLVFGHLLDHWHNGSRAKQGKRRNTVTPPERVLS